MVTGTGVGVGAVSTNNSVEDHTSLVILDKEMISKSTAIVT